MRQNSNIVQILLAVSLQLALTPAISHGIDSARKTTIELSDSSLVEIPDNAFLYALNDDGVDTDGDSLISYKEAEAVKALNIWSRNELISDLTGIEAFINLDSLSCNWSGIRELDLSHSTSLKYLDCRYNQLENLDLSGNPLLEYLACSGWNQISTLDLSHNIALKYLDCSDNQLINLDLSYNPLLEYLACGGNEFRELDLTQNKALKFLHVPGGGGEVRKHGSLNSLNISECTEIEDLNCSYNKLTSLDLSNNPLLEYLDCGGNEFRELDLTQNKALKFLHVFGGGGEVRKHGSLNSLNISECTEIEDLNCSYNKLTSLDLSSQPKLKFLDCGNNQLEYLDVSNNPLLESLRFSGNQISCLDISENKALKSLRISENSPLTEVCVSELPFPHDSIEIDIEDSPYVYFTDNCIRCNDTLAYIPDEAFLFELIESGIDINGDSLVSRGEAELVTTLNLSNKGIADLSGLEHFTELEFLDVSNNQISHLDITTQSELTYLNCEGNLLSMLNIAQNKLIDTLMISEMPRLTEVCAWTETFPPAGVYIDSFNSGNAYFTYLCECVGDLLEENDSYEEPVHIDTGQEYSDLFVSVNDDDWYIFHISNYFTDAKIHFDVNQFNGKIQADLWNEYPYPWGNPVNPILSSPISSENDLLELVLRPGEYWLRISSDSGSATAYSLNIDASSHPEVYSDPQSLTFEDANIYSTHTQKLTIGNQGTQELLIDSIHNTLLGSKISPATAAIRPGKVQEFTMEVFPRTLKEFSGELHFFMSNPSYGDMEIPVSGNGFLSRSVVILKEIIDTVSMGYWKARELKFPNYSADFILKLTQSAITYFLPEQKHDHILQPDSIAGTWVYTTLEGITVIPRNEDKNFWLVLDATDLQNGDYYADVVFEWYNPNYYKGFIPVILHVKDTIVSIPSAREPAGLVLYPNPTTGYLMIEVGEDDSYDVLITKLEGHLVYRSHMQGKTHELDLSCFQKGVYFITIRSKDFVTTRKIVKL